MSATERLRELDDPTRPMPTARRVFPPTTHRSQELAQAFREAVGIVHSHGAENPRPFFVQHRGVEDPDYNCNHPWCVRFWAMVREAEAAAEADEILTYSASAQLNAIATRYKRQVAASDARIAALNARIAALAIVEEP